jgi:N-acetyl-gamma-glutamylphosphate reductase
LNYGTSPDMTFIERKKKLTSYKVQNHEHLSETGDIKICGTDTEQG